MKTIIVNNNKGVRPNIDLTVRRVESTAWVTLGFHKHHYLTETMNKGCKSLLFEWNGMPVAFVGLLNNPGKGRQFDITISRIVILPDYQGLGLVRRIMDFCGGIVKNCGEGFGLTIKTAHDRMGMMLEHDSNWEPTSYNGKERKVVDDPTHKNRLQRKSYCYRYCGGKLGGYEDLLLSIEEMRERAGFTKGWDIPKSLELFDDFDDENETTKKKAVDKAVEKQTDAPMECFELF